MFFFCRFYVGVLIFLKGDLIAQPFERLIPPKVSFQKLFITGVPYDQGLWKPLVSLKAGDETLSSGGGTWGGG